MPHNQQPTTITTTAENEKKNKDVKNSRREEKKLCSFLVRVFLRTLCKPFNATSTCGRKHKRRQYSAPQ